MESLESQLAQCRDALEERNAEIEDLKAKFQVKEQELEVDLQTAILQPQSHLMTHLKLAPASIAARGCRVAPWP